MAQEIRKKSYRTYRRACNRAVRDGTASYRGGEITCQAQSSLGCASVSPRRPQVRLRPSRASSTTRRPRRAGTLASALSVMSWNAGSLSAQQWHELQEWASTCPYHALCIQETHWTGASLNFVPTDGMLWQVAMTPPGDPQPRALALQAGLIQCILALRGLLPPESLQQPTRSHDAANMAGTSGAPSHTSTATCQSYQRPSAHLTLKQVSAEHKRQVREHKKSRAASAIREISSSQRPILDYRTSALSC